MNEDGFSRVPWRDTADAPDGRLARAVRARLYRRGFAGYDYAGLARFKEKLAPRWETRDVAIPRGLAGLRALAALTAVHISRPRRPRQSARQRA